MSWCEEHDVDYVLGLARNARLVHALGCELHEARTVYGRTGRPARRFRDFDYRTRKAPAGSVLNSVYLVWPIGVSDTVRR